MSWIRLMSVALFWGVLFLVLACGAFVLFGEQMRWWSLVPFSLGALVGTFVELKAPSFSRRVL